VPVADPAAVISPAEAMTLFAGLGAAPVLLLAVSGGPDSIALMWLAARWRAARELGPELIAATVDHGLRAESAREARAVKRLAESLGIRHRTLRWTGPKPAAGLQQAARAARYRLLAAAARRAGANHVLTGHTLDDQAETVLLRMARGSGLTGLGAMTRATQLDALAGDRRASPRRRDAGLLLVRPLLEVPKARLVATLAAHGIMFADDPSNRDPRFTRARLRDVLPVLAGEGLDAGRLALLAKRLRRAEASIEFTVDVATTALSDTAWSEHGPILLDADKFIRLPAEVALRLLGRAIAHAGDRAPMRLGRLEALYETLSDAGATEPIRGRVRRTLAGALITLADQRLTIEAAPPRAKPAKRSRTLTTRIGDLRRVPKRR
jgi:tRNA(Ile)-lysidine synthase